jgi:DNA-binding beta-propeller fold protein YncE
VFKPLLLSLFLAVPLAAVSADEGFSPKPVTLDAPEGVYIEETPAFAFSPDGSEFYVFNRGAHALLVFDGDGNFLREIGQGLFEVPHGLRVDEDGNIWTADTGNHLVLKFAPSGEVLMVLGKRGTGSPGWFDRDYNQVFLNKPSDIAFDSDGNIYVADGGNFRIVKYSKTGDTVEFFGEKGSEPGQFNFPHSLIVDENGRLLVADRENKRIQIFNLDGKYQGEWNDIGHPYVLAQGKGGTFWMTDARVDQLVKLSKDGKVLDRFGGPGKSLGKYGFLHGVLQHKGSVYVSDILNWKVEELVKKR